MTCIRVEGDWWDLSKAPPDHLESAVSLVRGEVEAMIRRTPRAATDRLIALQNADALIEALWEHLCEERERATGEQLKWFRRGFHTCASVTERALLEAPDDSE